MRRDVYRAPMRARDRDLPPGAGAAHGVTRGLVGIGDALDVTPRTIDEAVAAASIEHGEKAGRMLRRFAELPEGAYVWTCDPNGRFHLGRICGPWRYDDGADARAVGIHHIRPARWLVRPIASDVVPAAVSESFARGGRNLQRINDDFAASRTLELWTTGQGGYGGQRAPSRLG